MPEATSASAPSANPAPRLSRLALAGFVLGLLALCTCFIAPLCGLPAVGCSHRAHAWIRASDGTLRGRRLAWVGLGMGYTAMALWVTMPVLILLSPPPKQNQAISCSNNLKMLSLGLLMYADDYGGIYPADLDAIRPYINDDKVFLCPGLKGDKRHRGCDYIYYGAGSTTASLTSPNRTVLLADRPGNHPATLVVGFADGHVESARVAPETRPKQLAQKQGWILPAAKHR